MRKKHILVLASLLMLTQLAYAQCKASKIYTQGGLNEVFTCPQDGNADIITFTNNDNSGAYFAYAITNSNNEILNIVTGNSYDFNPLPEGKYKVWGFSYTGGITSTIGEDVFDTEFSYDCFKISRTAVKVVVDNSYCEHAETIECQASTIGTTNGENKIFTCALDNNSDILTFTNNDNSGSHFVYVISNKSYKIVSILSGNSYDFNNSTEGEYIIWGFSYTGNMRGSVGESVFDTKFSDRCWKISRNCIEVMVEECTDTSNPNTDPNTDPDTGPNTDIDLMNNIFISSGETMMEICTGDGFTDVTFFGNNSTYPYGNYAYIITDNQNNITEFVLTDSYDFDGIPVGTCHVWGISYVGSITAQIGDNVVGNDFLASEFNLSSNHITVVKNLCGSTSLSANPNDFVIRDDAIVTDIDELNNSSESVSDKISIDANINDNQRFSSNNEIKVSPNPTSDKVFIDFEINNLNTTQTMISIYSTAGQLVSQKTVATAKGQNRFQMDLSEINSGLYRIVVQNGQTIKTKTISKINIR